MKILEGTLGNRRFEDKNGNRRTFVLAIAGAIATAAMGCTDTTHRQKDGRLEGYEATDHAWNWGKEHYDKFITVDHLKQLQQERHDLIPKGSGLSDEMLATISIQLHPQSEAIVRTAFDLFLEEYQHRQRHGTDRMLSEDLEYLMRFCIETKIAIQLNDYVSRDR